MLQLENVCKSYRYGQRRIEAMRHVNLVIEDPGFYAVMGASGSGKSTLLHVLAGLERPDTGHVRVDGQDLTALKESHLTAFRRMHIGIVFQQFNLIPTLTARQNIALPGVLARRPRRWIDSRVSHLLEELGLEDRAEHRPAPWDGPRRMA